MATPQKPVDFLEDIFQRDTGVAINEGDRLIFAKQITLGLALISSAIMTGYACYPDNKALVALIEIIKIGALPMATPVISFYFTSGTKK
ncbi:hypothetical protein GJ697_08800 [Pseudoduganella sp. FT25W]|uniref:Uncharacterized protein n=1 Tax=Duganella alba TaxID=2666081 RepID=A0A6L5QDV9_9BURK|nr:hypothetical protein [Duganella alba]MRX07927.1 hypothetical protein [Duganella alba]MRX15530.1 hypothetical protein [Duganella alba]